MNDHDQAANIMFGGTTPSTPAPAPREESLLSPDKRMADALYGDSSQADSRPEGEELNPQDDHAVASRLYDPQTTYRESIPDRLVDELGVIDPDTRQAVLKEIAEFRDLAGDLQVGNGQVEQLRDMQPLFDNVTHEQADGWRAESEQTLVREYGGAAAGELLADARLLVQQNPKLKAFLDEGARGNKLEVVRMVIDLARREKAAGRLTRGR